MEWMFGVYPQPQIEIGSIGWEGDDDDSFFDMGDESNDGHTLIKVQLFRGRDHTKPLNPNRAQGHKIVCHIPAGLFRIPPKDTRCYVAIPSGMETVPGAGIIIATVEQSHTRDQFKKDRAVIDFGDDTHVVIRGKSISLNDSENRFIAVGEPRSGGAGGITISNDDGTTIAVQEGVIGMTVPNAGAVGTIFQMKPQQMQFGVAGGAQADFTTTKAQIFAMSGYLTFGLTYMGVAPQADCWMKGTLPVSMGGTDFQSKLIFFTPA